MKKLLKNRIYVSINSTWSLFAAEKSTFVVTVHWTVHEQ